MVRVGIGVGMFLVGGWRRFRSLGDWCWVRFRRGLRMCCRWRVVVGGESRRRVVGDLG